MAKGTFRTNGVLIDDNGDIQAIQGDTLILREDNGAAALSIDTDGNVIIPNSDINGGTIDGTDITVGADKTLNVSAGTLTTSTAQNQAIVDDATITASDVGLGNVTNESKATMFTNPTFTGTVSGVTKDHVGLGNVTNESKATMFTNPTFTGDATINGLTVGRGGGTYASDSNTAVGKDALKNCSDAAGNNTALGQAAMYTNTFGTGNLAVGNSSLFQNTTGDNNTAIGQAALFDNEDGEYNLALGIRALGETTSGSGNIGIGFMNKYGTYAPVMNPTYHDDRLVMGHTMITDAYVKVSWTVTSDERDKMNFGAVPHGLAFVNQLTPISFQFRTERESDTPNGRLRYGFKAQDILALEGDNPVIINDEDADHLKYSGESLVPVLVNAVKELSAKLDEANARIAALESN